MFGDDLSATAFYGEYERLVRSNMTLLSRLYSVAYHYDDGAYEEDGTIIGVDGGVRFNPMAAEKERKGFFFGTTIEISQTDWDNKDDLPKGISIIPTIHLGTFFNTGSDDSSEVGLYSLFSVGVGFNF